ncbi:hypothetical protein L914_12329 [Phytophthora nicotianae]|uniref:Uncharacterized protein n=1 Tax=Phytophthora nicotianae TaxID=4792 RepID=W2IMJ9_PHYNI|nr:hypothetical protein L916_12410 [Phytophthora nicotianae]ETM41940.1 hypothetical protein L914_12329 [Phytophthora nicotianae]
MSRISLLSRSWSPRYRTRTTDSSGVRKNCYPLGCDKNFSQVFASCGGI